MTPSDDAAAALDSGKRAAGDRQGEGMSWSRRWRLFVLPAAAVVIAGLCLWRISRPPQREPIPESAETRTYPPRGWELYDQHRHVVKFDRYLGRQPVILRFAGAPENLPRDPLLLWLRDNYARVKRAGYEVLAVSTGRPVEIEASQREAGRPWPFPVLADLYERDPAPAPVHRLWGHLDPATGEAVPALFSVDRRGYVMYECTGRARTLPPTIESLERLIE